MKKFKKVVSVGLATMAAISMMSVSSMAAYTVPYQSNDDISLYVNYAGKPSNVWSLSSGSFTDTMNGISSAEGRGYSDYCFKTTSTKRCNLNVGNVDTNGTSGTVKFTVKDVDSGVTMTDAYGNLMVYTFTTDSDGSMSGNSTASLVFNNQSTFYFEIMTSNPTSTRCYGEYTISAY